MTGPGGKASFHRPELDLLRFAAFLLVFVHHGTVIAGFGQIAQTSSGTFDLVRSAAGYGLCLFFVLSSYLITEILLREREATGTIHIKAFYARRVLRIWPLYFAFLVVGLAIGHIWPPLHTSVRYVLQYVLLFGNYAFYAHNTANPIGPLWSISVEEQFYLCWPFLALRFGRRGLLFFSIALIPAATLWSSWLTAHAAKPGFAIWTHSVTEFECFAAGALLALALHHKSWRVSPAARVAFAVLGFASGGSRMACSVSSATNCWWTASSFRMCLDFSSLCWGAASCSYPF